MTADLEYKMIMALNAADIGDPICTQAASICAEIAEQHCAQIHQIAIVPVVSDRQLERQVDPGWAGTS